MAASTGVRDASALASQWVAGHKTKARLVAARAAPADGGKLLAFVEIVLEPGWKTYWRAPGDAGGLPPSFDWSKSANLAEARVMFPAPRRFTDKSGATIGYEGGLVLPVEIVPQSADLPVALVVGLSYGICKDVCVPIEAELALDVAPDADEAVPAEAQQALDRVPRAQNALAPGDPAIVRAESELEGASPKLTIEARFPEGEAGADVFLEASGGLFLPLPERVGDGAGGTVFEARLGADVDLAALKDKLVTITAVSDSGASFATFIAR